MADKWIPLAYAFDLVLHIEEDEELTDRKLSRALWAGKIKAVARKAIIDDIEEQEDVPLPTIVDWHGWQEASPVTFYWRNSRATSPWGLRKIGKPVATVNFAATKYYVVKINLIDLLAVWPDIDLSQPELVKTLGLPRSGGPGRPTSIDIV
ncbi:hypothetical protein, partial [Methylobacterium sp. WL7]|uniref:hypothetical protein n=1 Tax=Methylobacterium sp. WL7 TaxID=2603900 RepID=UPI0011C7CD97